MRTSTLNSNEGIPRSLRRRRGKRKKSKPSEDIELDDERQIYDETITLPCSTCKHEVDVRGVFFHKKQHIALATLGFHWLGGRKPLPSATAMQRQLIISKLLSSFTLTEKILQSINYAFELLWKKKIPAYYKIFDNLDGSSTYSPQICHVLIKGLAICEDRNSTWKADMNDMFTIVNNFGNKPNVCFLGMFDGHHGSSSADLASMELPILLLHQLSKLDPSYQMTPEEQQVINSFHTVFREEYTAIEDFFSSMHKRTRMPSCEYEGIHKAFAKAFWRMDRLLRLGRKEASRVLWSGCSAVTCILEGKSRGLYATRNWRTSNYDTLSDSSSSQLMEQMISGVLHIANAGNVQAVLCRNGKGFCLTKEHTTRNINERRRVLQNGAMISSNEPYGLLEGQVQTTRGLGFHGNLKLKKSIIPAPQTISIPIDDLCQFLILATNGLWEVLDKKEVTALAMTMFHVYKETYYSTTQNASLSYEPLLYTTGDPNITEPETDIHVLFQYEPHSKENVLDSKYSEYCPYNLENVEKPAAKRINQEPCNRKESCAKSFYEGAAEYVSHELVNAALEAGSRDNVTVMVIFLNGSEYQFLT